jgi:hypothetical protein|eukprot:COSAG02_NODE_1406_length_12786_cov_5.493418_16_plen_70_part_00
MSSRWVVGRTLSPVGVPFAQCTLFQSSIWLCIAPNYAKLALCVGIVTTMVVRLTDICSTFALLLALLVL